jgi:hypothetical protein
MADQIIITEDKPEPPEPVVVVVPKAAEAKTEKVVTEKVTTIETKKI